MAIVSIQSRVSYGHVGNSAAVFPLQRLGHEVWEIDTVQLSNHTGYGSWRGAFFGAEHVRAIALGLSELGVLARCDAVLSGYLGDADVAEAVLEALGLAREANPRCLYCCDPVMGDSDRGLYVREGIPELLRSRAIPSATIATPNRFELEVLAGAPAGTLGQALVACRKVQSSGPELVLVTGLDEKAPSSGAGLRRSPDDRLTMLLCAGDRAFRIDTPALPFVQPPRGAGDLTAALFLARYLEARDPRYALERCADGVFSVLERSYEAGAPEMLLIQSQDELARPRRRFEATEL